MKNKFIYLSVLALGFASCSPEFENEIGSGTYSAGDADFTTYVAVGNSLTAGYMDGTVFRSGQQNSFPNMLSQQFALAGGGEFTQPSFAEDVNDLGGLTLMGNQLSSTRLIINASVGGPQPKAGVPTIELTNFQKKAYNNMGVPGAKVAHLLAPGYGSIAGLANGTANPYFVRHATSETVRVMDDVMSLNPTFFTNWIGANDVLGYATSGGAGDVITDEATFEFAYTTITNALTSNGAKGVVATIPSVTSIPFFNTVPYNPLDSEDPSFAAAIPSLQVLYGALNQIYGALGITGRNLVINNPGNTALLIKDTSLADVGAMIQAAAENHPQFAPLAPILGAHFGQVRQATANDHVLLTTSGVIGTAPQGIPAPLNAYGISFPLENQMVLTSTEANMVNVATLSFNSIIKNIAASKGLAVADMNLIMGKLANWQTGLATEDGQVYYANYFSPAKIHTTLFSLDGVHPNAKGYAIVANEIIKVINSHYKSHLPLVDPSAYPTTTVLVSN